MPGGIYTGGGATVIMDPPPVVYQKLFYRGSEADRFTKRQAEKVALLASRTAPMKTGRLKRSIYVTQNRDQRGRFAFGYSVYADTPYAYYVHRGTGPSIRVADNRRAMRFRGTDSHSGQLVFTPIVKHPGTPANHFLERALLAMAV